LSTAIKQVINTMQVLLVTQSGYISICKRIKVK